MMLGRWLNSLLILILIICMSGCATTGSSTSVSTGPQQEYASNLVLTGQLRFEDIPVPVGFKLIGAESFVFQTEDIRAALLKYKGKAEQEQLVAFYQEQMLLFNWQLINMIEHEKSVLNFERNQQNCIVSIEPKGGKKIITISLAPKSKGNTKLQSQTK